MFLITTTVRKGLRGMQPASPPGVFIRRQPWIQPDQPGFPFKEIIAIFTYIFTFKVILRLTFKEINLDNSENISL